MSNFSYLLVLQNEKKSEKREEKHTVNVDIRHAFASFLLSLIPNGATADTRMNKHRQRGKCICSSSDRKSCEKSTNLATLILFETVRHYRRKNGREEKIKLIDNIIYYFNSTKLSRGNSTTKGEGMSSQLSLINRLRMTLAIAIRK